jgi:hypothetical protein
MGQLVFQATLGGQVNLVGPNTASTFNINVPAVAGNMVTTGDTGTVTNTMLAGSIANAKLTNSSVTVGSTAISLGGTATTIAGLTSLATNTLTSAAATALTIQSAGSTAITVDTSQNVGIGTSSPAVKLDVAGTIRAIPASGSATLYLNTSSTQSSITNPGSAAIAFLSSDVEKMRIDSSGNLLVGGTTSPSGSQNLYVGNRVYVGTTNSDPTFNRVSGLNITGAGAILSRSTGWDCGLSSTSGSNITFYTDNGSARVGAGSISSSGSVTAYNVTSDYRLKQNVQPMTNTLSLISQLKPCTYEYIEGNQYSEGFIAHELQAIVPHAVTGKKDAVDTDGNPVYQGVDASFLIPHLVAAVQELAAKVTALEAK